MEATAKLNPIQTPLDALLGIKHKHVKSQRPGNHFFATQLISQRLATLHRMVGGRSQIVMITGEKGSGKSTLIHRYMATSDRSWQSGRIRLKTRDRAAFTLFSHLNCSRIHISDGAPLPSIIIDHAHHLSPREIKAFLQWAYPCGDAPKLQSIILLADVQMRKRYAEIEACLPPHSAIDKINMTPLSEKQTADYLHQCIKSAGLTGPFPFSKDHIRTIHRLSGGLPGLINQEACHLAKKLNSTPTTESTPRDWSWPMLSKARRWLKQLGLTNINRQSDLDPTPWVP